MEFEIVPKQPEPIKKDNTLQVWLDKWSVKSHKDGKESVVEEVWIHVKRKDSDCRDIIAAISEHGIRLYGISPALGIAMNGNTVKLIS